MRLDALDKAKLFAVAAYVFNAVNVVNAKNLGTAMSSAWNPEFGWVYWIKTFLAVIALIYAGIACKQKKPRKLTAWALILSLYSVPVSNMLLELPIAWLFSLGHSSNTYGSRIPVLIFWGAVAFWQLITVIRRGIRA